MIVVTLGLCCLCVMQLSVYGAAFYKLKSAEVKGLVLYSDGETPAAHVPIRIWDVKTRKFIHETETNDFGRYGLPKLEPGEYFVTYDWTKLKLQVVKNGGKTIQQHHDVVVVIPRAVGFASIQPLGALLTATTLSETARLVEDEKTLKRVSP